MSITGTYKINQQKQLIDLNGQSVNFDLTFYIVSKNGEPFEVLVVDQNTLDSNDNLQYKLVEDGKISGNVVADKNIYQNYYLVIKSEIECDVQITIDKKDIPPQPPQIPPQLQNAYSPNPNIKNSKVNIQQKSDTNWKFIIAILVVCCLAIGYYFYQKKKGENPVAPQIIYKSVNVQPNLAVDLQSPPNIVSQSNVSYKSPSPEPVYNTELLDRLNKLKI